MAVTFRTTTSDYLETTAERAMTITEPTGASENDVLLAFVVMGTEVTGITAPSGWTEFHSSDNTTNLSRFRGWWIRRGASTPADMTFEWTNASNTREWICIAAVGCKTTGNPWNAMGTPAAGTNANPANPNPPSVTTTAANCVNLIVGQSTAWASSTWTGPTNYTTSPPFAGTRYLSAFQRTLSSATTEDADAITGAATGSQGWDALAIALEPDATATNTDYSPSYGSAVFGGLAALVNPQFASPSADATDGNWTPSTGTDLYACIDETLRSDTDYIQSGTNPSSDSCTVKLGTVTDPGTDVGFHLQYAAGAVGATGQVVVSLRQGNAPGTEIASWTHTGLPVGSYQEFDDLVTSAQAANITDYSDLYLRIVAS